MSSPRLVLAGTAYGECRGGGRIGMENILAVVINRVAGGWEPTPLAVCLATEQFSCWNDGNRHAITTASLRDQESWSLALAVADAALAGTLPTRIGDADSYYALSMARPAYWARSPARHVCNDGWHSFWCVHRRASDDGDTDALNAQELDRVLEHAA